MPSRAWPDSARAIISSALKVRINASDSSIVLSSAARYWDSSSASRNASSQRLRNRVSGVLRSCAILSDTSLKPYISPSIRSSMALRLVASRSSSSPVPAIGRRPARSPSMMLRVVSVIASTRLRTRRGTKRTPGSPRQIGDAEHDYDRQWPAPGGEHDIVQALALFEVASDQEAKAGRQLKHPDQSLV